MSEITKGLEIPDLEKANVKLLSEIIYSITKGNAELDVVGGVLKKPWPRKDIDITIKMPRESGKTELEKAQKSLNKLLNLVESVEEASNGYFMLGKTQNPYRDAQYDSDNILEHYGSVGIKPKTGTVIELISTPNE